MGTYLLTVICAAIVASIAVTVTTDKNTIGKLVKMISGLFVVITMISPWTRFSFDQVTEFWSGLSVDASGVVSDGQNMAQVQIAEIIKQETAAYILEKASMLDLDITVQVVLNNGDPPVPETIFIEGDISPYGKSRLKEFIYTDLGIAEANVIWN